MDFELAIRKSLGVGPFLLNSSINSVLPVCRGLEQYVSILTNDQWDDDIVVLLQSFGLRLTFEGRSQRLILITIVANNSSSNCDSHLQRTVSYTYKGLNINSITLNKVIETYGPTVGYSIKHGDNVFYYLSYPGLSFRFVVPPEYSNSMIEGKIQPQQTLNEPPDAILVFDRQTKDYFIFYQTRLRTLSTEGSDGGSGPGPDPEGSGPREGPGPGEAHGLGEGPGPGGAPDLGEGSGPGVAPGPKGRPRPKGRSSRREGPGPKEQLGGGDQPDILGPGQPRPSDSSSLVQPRPPDSSSLGQPRPPDSSSLGQPRPLDSSSLGQPGPPDSSSLGQPRPPYAQGTVLHSNLNVNRLKDPVKMMVDRGVVELGNKSSLAIDSHLQNVLVELGPPDAVNLKTVDAASVLGQRNRQPESCGYFYNYFKQGIDLLVCGQTHRIMKIIVHNNLPRHCLFGVYNRCFFEVYKSDLMVCSSDCRWSSLKRDSLGNESPPLLVRELATTEDEVRVFYGYPGVIFEIYQDWIASVTLVRHTDT